MTSSKERFRVNVANYDRLDTEMIRSGRTTRAISNPEIREKRRRAEGKGEELSRLYAETHSVQLLGKFRFVRIGLSLIIGFLVACYATLQPALSVRPSVRRSVGPSVHPFVGPSHFTYSALMGVLALLLLPKSSTDLNYGPCPPARDWGSRVSGLVFSRIIDR